MQTFKLLWGWAYRVWCELDSHTVSYTFSLLRNFQNILNSCRITALNRLCVFVDNVRVAGGRKSKTGKECKLLYYSLINIDSNSILLCIVKNTTWINFTISQFSVLIKKHQSPLKRSIPTKEAKERIPLPVYHPSALSIQRHMETLLGLFFLYTYSTTLNTTFQS